VADATVVPVPIPWQQRPSVRAAYVVILLVLAGCAFLDSFVALAELARASGALPGHRAITLPLMLDGLTLAGTLFAVTRFGPGQGSPAYGYVLIALGSLASLAGNIAHAPDTPGARVVAGAPPVILFLVFEAAAISFRRRPTSTPTPTSAAQTMGSAERAERNARPSAVRAPTSADQHPSADPVERSAWVSAAPAPVSAGQQHPSAGHQRPSADAASKRARAEGAYATLSATGTPVTSAQLAQAAGLSASYARALLAQFHTRPTADDRRNGQASIDLEGSA